jgi:hypothetical protein
MTRHIGLQVLDYAPAQVKYGFDDMKFLVLRPKVTR